MGCGGLGMMMGGGLGIGERDGGYDGRYNRA